MLWKVGMWLQLLLVYARTCWSFWKSLAGQMSGNLAKYNLKFYFSNLQNYQTVTKQNKDSEKYRNLKKQKLREEVQKQERN